MGPLLLNQITVTKAKLTMPGSGVWLADIELDLSATDTVPSGRCAFTVGTSVLVGTVDPRASGAFGPSAHVRLVGGGGGWDKPVAGLHIHNDFGVFSSQVYAQTAAEVGEVVVDTVPTPLGVDFVRTAGPASRVLAGVEWHVDISGVTTTGPRLPIPFNPLTVEVLSWDPLTKCATLASNDIVLPGTVLVDLRLGTATVRDVEQTFGPEGSRVIAWCDTAAALASVLPGLQKEAAGTRLARALSALAREACGVQYLKHWHYRVVLQNPANKRVTLQLTDLEEAAPVALTEIDCWPGLAASSHLFVLGTEVLVAFIDGDPSQPMVVGFAPNAPPPLETKIDAVRIALGAIAAEPVAKGPATQAQISAITSAIVAIAAWLSTFTALGVNPPTSTSFTAFAAALSAPGTTVATALGGLAASIASSAPLAVSTKTFTD